MNYFVKFLFCITLFSTTLFSLENGEKTDRIRVASYNVWNPTYQLKYYGVDSWDERLPYIIQTIHDADPDILCLQEVSLDCYSDLVTYLGKKDRYLSYYYPHSPKPNQNQLEGTDGLAIFIKPYLIDGVQVNTSKKIKRPKHRRDLWVNILVPGLEKALRVATVHVDANDAKSGDIQLENFVKDITEDMNEVSFLVVCGDYNEGSNEKERPRYSYMIEQGFLTDGSLDPTRPEEFNDILYAKGHVDWIYFKNIDNASVNIEKGAAIGSIKASDHKLIYTDFYFNN